MKETTTMKMPKEITVRREITYSTEPLLEYLRDEAESAGDENTYASLLDWIFDNAVEDLANSHFRIKMYDEDKNEIFYEEILNGN
jgi:hypothetical protein